MTSDDIAETTMMTGEEGAVDDDVLGSVFSTSRDRSGNSAPEPDVKDKPPEAAAEPPLSGEVQPPELDEKPQGRDPKTGRFVPVSELLAERKKYQSRADEEAQKREAAEARARDLETKFQALEHQQRQFFANQQRQQQPEIQPPDPFTDPEGAFQYQQRLFDQQIYETRLVQSIEMMRQSKPDFDQFAKIFVAEIANNPAAQMQVRQHPFPGRFVYEEGRRLAAMQEIGTDFDGYKERLKQEARQQVLEELKAGRQADTPPQKFPGTLAAATGAGQQGAVLTDEAMASGIFSSSRKRR